MAALPPSLLRRGVRAGRKLPESAALLLFPLLAGLLLGETLSGRRVLLPAEYLFGFLPWKLALAPEAREALPPWNVLQWDAMAEFYPWRLHLARSLAAGSIPLWNPFVFCGTPFLANSQSAPLYPIHWLYGLAGEAGAATAMSWVAFLHLSLAGIFTFLLCRHLGARPAAALVGGAAFELSGFAVAWLELPSFLSVGCWIPLLLLTVCRALQAMRREGGRPWGWTLAAGTTGGLMLLGGHLQIAFYGALAALLVAAWEVAAGGPGRIRPWQPLAAATVAGALALALASPQLLPALELSRISHRAGRPSEAGYAEYVRRAPGPRSWITLLVPDYYGLPARGDFVGWWREGYGPPNVMEYAGHIGAAGFLLALLGIVGGGSVLRVGTALLPGVVGGLLATGSPLCRWFYFAVPGFAQSGSPGRALVLVCLSQALLAGLGTEALVRRAEAGWKAALLPATGAAAATAALLLALHALALATAPAVVSELERAVGPVRAPALLRALLWAGVTAFSIALLAWLFRENSAPQRAGAVAAASLASVAGGLLLLGSAYNPTAPRSRLLPDTPLVRALSRTPHRVATVNRRWSLATIPEAVLPPNVSMVFGWRDAQGYDSLYLGHYRRLANAAAWPEDASPLENGNLLFIKRPDSPLQPLFAARYVVSAERPASGGLRPARGFPAGPPYVFEDPRALPEAALATDWLAAEDDAALARFRRDPATVLRQPAVAPEPDLPPPPSFDRRPPVSTLHAGAVPVERLSPQAIRVSAAPRVRSLLVLGEGYAPGWRAWLRRPGGDRRELPVRRVNVAFQGVFLEPGLATVEFRYEPASFRVGLFLGLLALAGLAAGAAALRPRATPSPGRYPGP